MKLNKLKPAFTFQFKESLRAVAVFFAIMIFVFAMAIFAVGRAYTDGGRVELASFTVSTSEQNAEYPADGSAELSENVHHAEARGNFAGYGVSAMIMLFVFGICNVRENMRLMLQCGISRKTTFFSHLLSMLTLCAAVAVFGELLTGIGQALVTRYPGFVVADLYQICYIGLDVRTLTFLQHVQSAIFTFSYCALLYLCGSFISLVFYRLSKLWRIVVGVGVPLMLFVGFPLLFMLAAPITGSFNPQVLVWITKAMVFIFTVYGRMIVFVLLGCALVALLNWLLMRRAPVKAAAK